MKFFNTFDFIENFFPNTPIAFLIFLFSFFLFTTIFVLIIFKLAKEEKTKTLPKPKKKLTMDDLLKIAKNKDSTLSDLVVALEYFNEEFKVKNIPDKAFEFFKHLLSHKNRNKILFDIFHNKTVKLNKEYKEALDRIERDALNEKKD